MLPRGNEQSPSRSALQPQSGMFVPGVSAHETTVAQILPCNGDLLCITELKDETWLMRQSGNRPKQRWKVDVTVPGWVMPVVAAVGILNVDVLQNMAVLTYPLVGSCATPLHADAHVSHIDAVLYPR